MMLFRANFVVNLKFEEFQLDNNGITIMPFRLGVFVSQSLVA